MKTFMVSKNLIRSSDFYISHYLIANYYVGLSNTKELPNSFACHRLVEGVTPAGWKRPLDDMSLERLCDLHDKSYTRQAILDNHLNARTRELIQTVKNAKEELSIVVAREKSRELKYAELEAKCDQAAKDLEKNPVVQGLRVNIMKLASQLKEAQVECGKLKLEGSKLIGLQERVKSLESKCEVLEVKKSRLLTQEGKLKEEVNSLVLRYQGLQEERAKVVSKVVPYIAMELYHSDEVGKAIADLVNAAIYHGKCTTLEEIAATGEPVILSKVKYYRPSHEREYDHMSNVLASAEFPFLSEATIDPLASVTELLSKKPRRIRPPSPGKKTSLTKPPILLHHEDRNSSKNV